MSHLALFQETHSITHCRLVATHRQRQFVHQIHPGMKEKSIVGVGIVMMELKLQCLPKKALWGVR